MFKSPPLSPLFVFCVAAPFSSPSLSPCCCLRGVRAININVVANTAAATTIQQKQLLPEIKGIAKLKLKGGEWWWWPNPTHYTLTDTVRNGL